MELTYEKPEHGWTCFHCGETFTTVGAARDHFGATPEATPGCLIKAGGERGLLMALRKSEDVCASLLACARYDTNEAVKAYYAQQTRHRQQLIDAEEAGYERGLRDARAQEVHHEFH